MRRASERILAFDPTFVPKAGKHTFSRDYFWNGCANQAQKGLEISALAVVDINQNQALTLSARQTFSQEEALQMCGVSTLSDLPAAQDAAQAGENETRMGQYLEHIRAASAYFTASEQYLTVDGSFANANFIDGVSALGLDVIGKLRCDANMRYLKAPNDLRELRLWCKQAFVPCGPFGRFWAQVLGGSARKSPFTPHQPGGVGKLGAPARLPVRRTQTDRQAWWWWDRRGETRERACTDGGRYSTSLLMQLFSSSWVPQ